jgi:uncharacterized protein involved in propanediol utilization
VIVGEAAGDPVESRWIVYPASGGQREPEAPVAAWPRVGRGACQAHHGEIWQGAIQGASGQVHRALVSLPCDLFGSQAVFTPRRRAGVAVREGWRVKARRAAEITLSVLRLDGWGGQVAIDSNIPPGWGLGSSTSDVVSTVRATAAAFGVRIGPREVARIAIEAEVASDSTMFGNAPVLFGHREGVVIEQFAGAWPSIEVLGFNDDASGRGVDTIAQAAPGYTSDDRAAFVTLIAMLRRAFEGGDHQLLGRVSTESARMNQRLLPRPRFHELEHIARVCSALGLQVAHSGTVMGLLFAPGRRRDLRTAQALLAKLGVASSWRFTIPPRSSARRFPPRGVARVAPHASNG